MLASVLVAVVAAIHIYIVVLEMVLWDKPAGMKAFNLTPDRAALTRVMAANQGLYNGFLAAGLIWGLIRGAEGVEFQVFFLLCVAVAGIYGAMTVSRRILMVQTVPAALALLALWAGV